MVTFCHNFQAPFQQSLVAGGLAGASEARLVGTDFLFYDQFFFIGL